MRCLRPLCHSLAPWVLGATLPRVIPTGKGTHPQNPALFLPCTSEDKSWKCPPSAYTSPGCIKGSEYVCSWGFSWVNPCVGGGPTQVHRPPWSPPAAPLGASRRCPVLALSCYPGRGQAAGVRAGAAPGGEGVVIKGFGLNDIIELDKGRIFL